MFSLLKTLSEVVDIFKRPSEDEWRKGTHQTLTNISTAHWARCTLAVRSGLLPENWDDLSSVKVTEEQWNEVELFHNRMLATDADYKKEYLAELAYEQQKMEKFNAMLGERGLDPTGGRPKE